MNEEIQVDMNLKIIILVPINLFTVNDVMKLQTHNS